MPVHFTSNSEMDPALGYGGFTNRAGALAIDSVLVIILAITTKWLSDKAGLINTDSEAVGDLKGSLASAMSLVQPLLVPAFYFSLFESSKYSATPGKRLMGLIVTDRFGGRLTFKLAMRRFVGRILSLFTLNLGYLLVLFDKRRRALHDRVANTYVIQVPSSAKLSQTRNYVSLGMCLPFIYYIALPLTLGAALAVTNVAMPALHNRLATQLGHDWNDYFISGSGLNLFKPILIRKPPVLAGKPSEPLNTQTVPVEQSRRFSSSEKGDMVVYADK